jgi:hypothetical protein
MPVLLPLDEQVVDVALPVGHDDDPCLATPILHGTDRTVALEPPAALLLFDRPLVPFVPRGLLGSGPDAGVAWKCGFRISFHCTASLSRNR